MFYDAVYGGRRVFDSENPPPPMTRPIYQMIDDKSLLAFSEWTDSLTAKERRQMSDYMREWR